MRRIAAFICAITLASATIAAAAPMPWRTFNEPAMLSANTGAQMMACPSQGEIFVAVFRHETASYVMVFSPDTRNIIFVYDPNPTDSESLPTEIGFGHVDKYRHNEIPPLFWVPFQLDAHGDVCALLFKSGA